MAQCIKVKRKVVQVCVGGMRELITVYDRAIMPPSGTGALGVDFRMEFKNGQRFWAAVDTVRGRAVRDETNVEVAVTHKFTLRYSSAFEFSIDQVVEFQGRYFRVVDVELLGEEGQFAVLRCSERGKNNLLVNYA